MKFSHISLMSFILMLVFSCTIDPTDYEAEIQVEIEESYVFEEAVVVEQDGYRIQISSLNGTLNKGYNELQLKVTNLSTQEQVHDFDVDFLPIMRLASNETKSGPHQHEMTYTSDGEYYQGYVVFPYESTEGTWNLYLNLSKPSQTINITQEISVVAQPNKNLNMTAFTGNDGVPYFIALMAPQRPKIAENELVAGIYKYNAPDQLIEGSVDPSQYEYSIVDNYTLLLDPRMPEPSMGNHSSPNNVDLTQGDNGHYYGVVNYTMTGNWTLNFIMLNAQNQTIKGTEVPTDFTPGIHGAKSELFIDILF